MRRRVAPTGALTSLLDVLFILVFASLVQSTARGEERRAEDEAAEPEVAPEPVTPPAPAPPASMAAMRKAAAAVVEQHVERAPLVVARIAADGTLVELEHAEKRPIGVPLLEQVADPDIGVAYLGDRARALQVCGVVAHELRLASLSGHVVVIAPEVALAELPVALVAGLRRDVSRCQVEHRAMAVIVEPDMIERPAEGSAP